MGPLGHLTLALFRHLRRYRVSGDSMSPTLCHGDLVWVDAKTYEGSWPRPGQIVVACHPFRRDVRMVKRVVRALGENRFVLAGDNAAESTDSRVLGSIPASLIIGRVIVALRPAPLKLLSVR